MKVRRRAFAIPLSALAELLTHDARWHRGRTHSGTHGVPEGAVPLHAYCEPDGKRVVVVFAHESFPEAEIDLRLAPWSATFDHVEGEREVEPEPLDTLESLTAHVAKPRSRVRST